MNLRSGTVISSETNDSGDNIVNTHPDSESKIEPAEQRRSSARLSETNRTKTTALRINEIMLRHIDKINNEENKKNKLQYLYDFYVFLNDSCDDILIPEYRHFIEAVVDKTREHMKTLEEKYFPEMITTLDKILLFDCYFILLKVKNKCKNYLRIYSQPYP